LTLLVGALTIGLILSLLALGVYISFRVFSFPDITADGSILFRLLLAIALRWGMDPNDLKLVTSLFVLAALVLPVLLAKSKPRVLASHAPDS
jgi:ABC-type uncharacterized transport system permease subunit